jgi:hypothetical protein
VIPSLDPFFHRRGGSALVAIVATSVLSISCDRISDPYRTLELFPADRYFSEFAALAGSEFKMEATVENDLGWNGEKGRLMAFSVASPKRTIAVLIPKDIANTVFSRGQQYKLGVRVGADGLIEATKFEKL